MDFTSKNFLIADDDKSIRDKLISDLMYFGVSEVYSAIDGSSAFRKLSELEKKGIKIHFLISDFVMPNGDGLSLVNKIKSDNIYKSSIPILMLDLSLKSRTLF